MGNGTNHRLLEWRGPFAVPMTAGPLVAMKAKAATYNTCGTSCHKAIIECSRNTVSHLIANRAAEHACRHIRECDKPSNNNQYAGPYAPNQVDMPMGSIRPDPTNTQDKALACNHLGPKQVAAESSPGANDKHADDGTPAQRGARASATRTPTNSVGRPMLAHQPDPMHGSAQVWRSRCHSPTNPV